MNGIRKNKRRRETDKNKLSLRGASILCGIMAINHLSGPNDMRTQMLNLALFMIFVSYLYPDQASVQPVLQPDEAMFKGD